MSDKTRELINEPNPDELHPLLRGGQEWFSPKEFSQIVPVTPRWVYDRCEEKLLGHARLGPKLIFIPRAEVLRVLRQMREQVAASLTPQE